MTVAALPTPEPFATEARKTAHMTAVWSWLLTLKPQPCGNCCSEFAILAVERDVCGNKEYRGSDKMCRKRELGASCMDRVRPLWKGRPMP